MNKYRYYLVIFFIWAFMSPSFAQSSNDVIYLFSYFKGNGDGLHLAYSEDGYKWDTVGKGAIFLRPTAGKDKLMRDPCIIRGRNGNFHMVWTVSWNEKGIGYASSPDLIHWSEQQYIPVMEHEPEARNCWAPEITYDDRKKRYLIYWATTIDNRFPQKDTAAESKYNHRMYCTTTKDFKTFSKTKLFYEPGFSVIDATIVRNKKKQYLMFFKNETRWPEEKNIRLATTKKLKRKFGKPSAPITGKYWAEGPTAIKIGEQWIVYFDKYRDHAYGAVASTDLKTWTDISEKVNFPPGIRHGTVFTVTRAEFEKLNKQDLKSFAVE